MGLTKPFSGADGQSGDLAESHPITNKLRGLRKVVKILWASVSFSVKQGLGFEHSNTITTTTTNNNLI